MNSSLPFALVYTALESDWEHEVIEVAIHNVQNRPGKSLKLPDMIAAVREECDRLWRQATAIRKSVSSKMIETPGWKEEGGLRLMEKFAAVRRSCEGKLPKWANTHPQYVKGYQRQSCANWGYDRRANQ